MKILFSITYYRPYVSGLTIAAERFAEALVKKGNTVTILAMRHDVHLPETETIHGVTVRRAPWVLKFSKGFVSFAWLVQSWREVRDHDVVVVNLPQFEGIVPALFAKLTGKKLIAIYHCEVVLPEGFINTIIQSLLEVSNMVTLLLADHVVTYTSNYARSSRLLRYVRSKLVYIVPPVLVPKTHARVSRQLEKRIGTGSSVIGVSARLSAEKGIEYVLEALPLIQSNVKSHMLQVVIAGPMDPVGEESYKKMIMKLVRKYKKYVLFLGEILPEDMGSFYRSVDILVLPSVNKTEAFGLVQVEAMLCGVPVVASNLPGVRVPITKTRMGILVPPADVHALATAISTVLEHKMDYVRSTEEIQKYFSPEKSVEEFIALL